MPFSPVVAYKDEGELEKVFFEEYKQIFGENSYLLSNKVLIKTEYEKIGTVPDGIVINFETGEWFVVEVELIRHNTWTHITPQLVKILVSLQNPAMKIYITRQILKDLKNNPKILKQIQENLEFGDIDTQSEIEDILEYDPIVYIPIDSKENSDLDALCKCFKYKTMLIQILKVQDKDGTFHYTPDKQIKLISPTKGETIISTETPKVSERQRGVIKIIMDLGGTALTDDIYKKLPDVWTLNESDKKTEPDGRLRYIHHCRNYFASLLKRGYLENPSKGSYKVTELGKSLLSPAPKSEEQEKGEVEAA